jgi:hypothetical protein
MTKRCVAASFERPAGPPVDVEADVGRRAGTVDRQALGEPEG